MKPSKELFDLIKSMSGSEKRYFKLNVSHQKGNKNYLVLFDTIENQKVFDEQELRKILKDKNVSRNLTITKNYLYKLIIKILTQFRNESSIDLKLNLILSKSKLMYEKGLFPQFFKTVKAGKDAALRYERFTILLNFIELEKILIKKDEIGKKNMDLIYVYESKILEWIKLTSHYKRIITNLFLIMRINGIVRNKDTDLKISEYCSGFDADEQIKNIPVRTRQSILLAKYLECRLRGEFKESIKYCRSRFKLVINNPDVFRDDLLDPRLDSLGLLITSALKFNNIAEAKSVFNKLKKLTGNNEDIDITLTDFDIKLSEYIESENKNNGNLLIPAIENYLRIHKGKVLINTENYFRFNIAKFYFMTENYLSALDRINEFLKSKHTKLTPEYESYSRILNIMIHYELGNYSLLKYLIPTTRKFLTNKKKYFKYESEILRSVKKLVSLKEETTVNKCFNELFKKLLLLKKDKYERNAFVYFDPERWVEKKILKNQK